MRSPLALCLTALALLSLAADARADSEGPVPPPTVRVHVANVYSVDIQMQDGPYTWRTVCTRTCDADLPTDRFYRVAGLGGGEEPMFYLWGEAGEYVELEVEPAVSHRGAGIGFAATGGGLAMVSLFVLAIGGLSNGIAQATYDGPGQDPNTSTAYEPAAAVIGGAAAIALATGVGLLVSSHQATVTQQRHARELRPEAKAVPSGPTVSAWMRLPTSRQDTEGAWTLPPATLIPLFTTRF